MTDSISAQLKYDIDQMVMNDTDLSLEELGARGIFECVCPTEHCNYHFMLHPDADATACTHCYHAFDVDRDETGQPCAIIDKHGEWHPMNKIVFELQRPCGVCEAVAGEYCTSTLEPGPFHNPLENTHGQRISR